MIGLKTIRLTPDIVMKVCAIEAFRGYWEALEEHTTGLNLLSDYARHGQAFRLVLDQFRHRALSAQHVRGLYQTMVMQGEAVAFRADDEGNEIIVNVDGVPAGFLERAPAVQIEPLLGKLLSWIDEALEAGDLPPVLCIAVFHVVFLQIGPFHEGNQKLCAILTQIYMFKAGYSYAPYVPIDALIAESAGEYYRTLKHVQKSLEHGEPDWAPWLVVFCDVVKAQADQLRFKIQHEAKDLSHLPTVSSRVMALFEEHKRLKMKDLIHLTQTPRATLKLRLGELIEAGYLKRYGGGRSTWYSL